MQLSARRFSSGAISRGARRVLVTGALGQIGQELCPALALRYGVENVVATDVKPLPDGASTLHGVTFRYGSVLDTHGLSRLVVEHGITHVIHNASILSARGEQFPMEAMELNMRGLENLLLIAQRYNLGVFTPSSIAAFGKSTPPDNVPDFVIQRPSTIYGVSKVYAELLGEYFFAKFGVDFRSARWPGVISSVALPGGGTTDYAVDIYYHALTRRSSGPFKCFLKRDTMLPMMHMDDTVRAYIQLMEAPAERLTHRTYNVTATAWTPEEQAASIRKYIPDFQIVYEPDQLRQGIADSWPHSLDDSLARKEWGWAPQYDLDGITRKMLTDLSKRLGVRNPIISK